MRNMHSVAIPEEQYDVTQDRLSILPWDVLYIILSFLPILDAVKTSVLAKDWRDRWLSISEFALDCNLISFKDNDNRHKWTLVSSIINKYLRDHTGPITQFYLRTNFGSQFRGLNQWIGYLSTQDVEILNLQHCKTSFWLTFDLFSCKKLKKLFLGGCVLSPPRNFEGFNYLHSLDLRKVIIYNDRLNFLIFSCPILEKLTLLNITGLKLLRIRASRLTVLFVDTGVEDISFEVASCLATVTIVIADVTNPRRRARELQQTMSFNSHGVTRSLLALDTIKELGISGDMIKHLAVDYGVGDFPWTNSTVTSLEFNSMIFDTVEEFHVCLSLLSSCSNVRHLYFKLLSAYAPELATKYFEENRGRFLFPQLISLKMICPEGVGVGCMDSFLEFIGAHTPNIKFLTVVEEGTNSMNRTHVRQMLTRLRKTCPLAFVRYVHGDPYPEPKRLMYQ